MDKAPDWVSGDAGSSPVAVNTFFFFSIIPKKYNLGNFIIKKTQNIQEILENMLWIFYIKLFHESEIDIKYHI